MKLVMFATTVAMMTAAPLMAQTDRAYVAGYGGFASAAGTTSADAVGEAGVRIAPHLSVIGDIGRFRNLQPSEIQPAIDATTVSLADTQGVAVVGTGKVPAWYSAGGLRDDLPTGRHVLPYVSGDAGYRFSRVAADTPLNAQGMTFGVGYRF